MSLIRFGKWEEIIAAAAAGRPGAVLRTTTAMIHYAKAVAYAALGSTAAAEAEAELFGAAVSAVPPSRYVFNNTCLDILAVAAEMMKGEIAYRKGEFDAAFAHLRKSVELDDNLPYDEPWGWMQPTRHALGALLLEQGRVEEAEAVYRADLGLDGTLSRRLPASRECLEPAWISRMPGATRQTWRSEHHQGPARCRRGLGRRADQVLLLLPTSARRLMVTVHFCAWLQGDARRAMSKPSTRRLPTRLR